ncbi:MAG: phage holin family protein [Mycobacteriales bacterium]
MTPSEPAPATPRPRRHRLRQSVVLLIVSAAILWIVVFLLPGVDVSAPGGVLLAIVVLGTVSAILRPVLAAIASLLGWLGVALVGLFAQALIFAAALAVTPGISVSGFWPAFWASWLYAFVLSAVSWVFDAHDDELFLRDVLRQAGRRGPAAPSGPPGVVILQIDGLAAPLLRWAVQSGDLPTLGRWIRSGTHELVAWHAQLPPTTPASQAGILHGRSDAVPAFRWYEKDSGRLTVTNHPKDAAYVEKGMTDGRGLLAGGGVSVGNIFSGDATSSLLTMSSGRGHGPTRSFTASYLRPFGFTRSVLLTLGEMVKELYQGHEQQARGIQPRIDRRSSYVALRGLTNVLLRDLNVRLLAEQMMAGVPVMYCDFTDYDEVAHHAGPTRPESLASLVGVDRAIALLERVAGVAPRPYQFVVLSDHGQSQGATFRQRYGEPLEDVVRRFLSPPPAAGEETTVETVASTDRDEEWGPVTTFLREVGSGRGPLARLGRHVVHRHQAGRPEPAAPEGADLIVTGSGNLAFLYFPHHPHRLSKEELDRSYPGLVESLADHDGIGFVVVRSEAHGTVALGPHGVHFVDERRVEGVDPLEPFGPAAAEDVRRHAQLAHVGDIVVNSRLDDATGEVAAFEELVGCHGGLGGWQSDAVLVHPSHWAAPGPLVGADALHGQLVRWLEDLGQRQDLAPAAHARG